MRSRTAGAPTTAALSFGLMDATTVEVLRAARWSESRRVATADAERLLAEDGYELFDGVRNVLAEFGGLTVGFQRNTGRDELAFNVASAVGGIYRERVQTYEPRCRTKLVPIGEVYQRHMTVVSRTIPPPISHALS